MKSARPSSRAALKAIARRAMADRGLEPDFSRDALNELGRLRGPAPLDGAQDLRDRLWVSIDNDDSRDLDQLSVAEALPDGAVKVWVAVADVDAVVAQNTALDAHARANTTSVYTAAEIFPMLPEKLSTNWTSLNENEDRLAMVVEVRIEPKNRARSLIEDFMIAANGVTARFLASRGCPSLRRVVRSPERWARIVAVAGEYGEKLPAEPDATALEAFLV